MNGNFMGLGGIADRALLKSGMEALAIGFPLDGPVRDATLMGLKYTRHAHLVGIKWDKEWLTFLEQVQARYPTAYAELAETFAKHLANRSTEIHQPPLLLSQLGSRN